MKSLNKRIKQPSNTFPWEIRKNNNDFKVWLRERNSYALFFDGASKGNPGLAGDGGVFMSANGTVLSRYSWGLGTESNNIAEFCGLLQGLKTAISKGIVKLTVFGDSHLLIQAVTRKKHPTHIKLAQIYQKIQILSKKF